MGRQTADFVSVSYIGLLILEDFHSEACRKYIICHRSAGYLSSHDAENSYCGLWVTILCGK